MQLRRQIRNLGKNVYNTGAWTATFVHKTLSIPSISNLISIIALVIAYNSLKIANKSLDTSLNTDTFVKKQNALLDKESKIVDLLIIHVNKTDSTNKELIQLLSKTDTAINLAGNQLEIGRIEQQRSNQNYENIRIGEMNRLYTKANQLNDFMLYEFANINGINLSVDGMKIISSKLEGVKSIFNSELNSNSYLNGDDSLAQLWNLAYRNINDFLQQMKINIEMEETGIQKYDTAILNGYWRTYGMNFTLSFSAAVNVAKSKINKDRIKRGVLDKNGKSKIDPIIYWR